MTTRGSSEQARRRRGRMTATVVAVLLALSGAAATAVGVAGQDPAPPSPRGGAAATAPDASGSPEAGGGTTDRGPATSTRRGSSPDAVALDYSEPVHVSIPSIGVSSSLIELGLDGDGVMETPQPPHVDRAGWFRPSPPPGVPGATVIAGHVTWDQEPVVFFELGELGRGDRVQVRRADGIVTVFEVTKAASFPKDEFPTAAVYDQPDQSELRLITCGGEYDEAANRYLDNVIVWAELVDTRRGRPAA